MRIEFCSESQWPAILESSYNKEVYIFKHSSRCGVSFMVLKRFEKQVSDRESTYFHLHIQACRTLSNWLEQELGIRHESPQLIVLKNGEVVAHDSHYGILEILNRR